MSDLEKSTINILETHNLWAKKFLGQNFLINNSTLEKIVETADISSADKIIEVGPGLGVLTTELIKKAGDVISIELDPKLIPILEERFKETKNLEIIHKDALQFIPPTSAYKVVANIPYNITSPIINHFLQAETPPTSMTLLVQKEVAEKIIDQKKLSILALQVKLFGEPELVKTVPSSHFLPAPKVDSAILHIKIKKDSAPDFIPKDQAQKILRIARQAFAQRRKKLSNTLPKQLLEKTDIDPDLRPEKLSVNDWKKLI